MNNITQDLLKELFDYNPETGVFIRKIQIGRRGKVGTVPGHIDNGLRSGYRKIKINRKNYLEHRLAWLYQTGEWPINQIDHIDHDRVNNKWNNLRETTNTGNQKNTKMRSNNTSGHTGVSWHKVMGKWLAFITVDGDTRKLGYFDDIDDAIAARQAANIKYRFHENHGI